MRTADQRPSGAPYPSDGADSVDEWSLDVFAALKDWSLARENVWSRWDPGYLLLEIERAGGEPVDRIVLYTANDEIMVEFGL